VGKEDERERGRARRESAGRKKGRKGKMRFASSPPWDRPWEIFWFSRASMKSNIS